MTLGERVLVLRRRKGLTQGELAKHAGVNKMTIWRLEHNAILDVKGQVLGRMAEVLGCSTDYLLGREEEPQDRDLIEAATPELVEV
jgi:transcriptional regulator with XRE-family HTH domain